jgi:flavorubredoxin
MNVLMLYFTKTGHTLEAAVATAEGIRSAGSRVELVTASDFDPAQLTSHEALIVASPCWAGSVGRPVLARPVDRALHALTPDALRGKRCGGISVHSGMGAENTIQRIGEILTLKGCADYRPGPVARAGVPLSLWKGPSVNPEDEARFSAYGTAFVT